MSRQHLFLANSLLVLASVAFTLLALELVLRFLPIAAAPPVRAPTLHDPIQRYLPDASFTWSMDWNLQFPVRGHTNAQGWVADYDYDPAAPAPLVAVAGDSFIEALSVPFPETLTGRLQAQLESRGRAYAFAQSGAPLSQYVAYARHACSLYHPERLVVTVVGNDFDESIQAHRKRDGFFHLYPRPDGGFDFKLTPLPPPSFLEAMARHSALILYLVRNLGIAQRIGSLWQSPAMAAPTPYVGNTEAAADPARIAEGEQVIAWFVDTLPKEACLPPHSIVLVIDAMRPEIYDGEAALSIARASYFSRMRSSLMAAARSRGYVVVDMEPYFRAAFAKDGRRFEFPQDNHWNAHGHEIVFAAVRKALHDWPPIARSP